MNDWVKTYIESMEEMMPDQLPRANNVKDFLNSKEIRELGITCGENCLLHKTTLVYGAQRISMGHDVRIDAFNVLSAGEGYIKMGSHIHISSHCLFVGGAGIIMENFTNVAAGCKLYSMSDSFKGDALIGPMVPEHTREVKKGEIIMEMCSTLGANCIMMPCSYLSYGSMMHANSLLVGISEPNAILAGQPAKKIKDADGSFERFVLPDSTLRP